MNKLRSLLAAAFLCGISFGAQAQSHKLGQIDIDHPYARSTAPGQPAGGAYLRLQNHGKQDDRLVSASTPAAAGVQLHTMKMEGDVMRMRQVDAINVPAGKSVVLQPGGMHLMLIGLKGPLEQGQTIPLTLKFERAGEVNVELHVEAVGAGAEGMKH